jgi:O-acetyl-ADP-ribose deacetylase (regulator of RNase III)
MEDAARIALTTVRRADPGIDEVRFVLFDAEAYSVFERVLKEIK